MTQAIDALEREELERDLILTTLAAGRRRRRGGDEDTRAQARASVVRAVVGSSYFHAHDRRRARELVSTQTPAPRRWLRVLPAIAAALLVTAAIAAAIAPAPALAHLDAQVDAHAHAAQTPPSAHPAPGGVLAGVDVVDVPVPAEWRAAGERLAADYAAAVGYGDACAGHNITSVIARDLKVYGRNVLGVAEAGGSAPYPCAMAIAASELVDRCAYLRVYVHERLHLARNDGWHAKADDPSNPLGPFWTPPGCQYLPGIYNPRTATSSSSTRSTFLQPLTQTKAKVAVRKRFDRRRWAFRVCLTDSANGRLERVIVCVERKARRRDTFDSDERRYEVTRDVFGLKVRRVG